jgi:hypothetical protein
MDAAEPRIYSPGVAEIHRNAKGMPAEQMKRIMSVFRGLRR